MARYYFILFFTICSFNGFSQLKNMVVEKYYVSDLFDATDASQGALQPGTITYRVYIELEPGSILLKVYGDESHPISIASSLPFYNHEAEGVNTAKDLNISRYAQGTLPLDSWITLGMASKASNNKALFGLLKGDDADGSIIGGNKNDGGVQQITGGLLVNTDLQAGIPIFQADGFIYSSSIPTSWVIQGLNDPITGEDSSIFSKNINTWLSRNFQIKNDGIQTAVNGTNNILVLQLSTKGDLSFQVNIEAKSSEANGGQILKYVSSNQNIGSNEIYSPLLKYPQICGCKNPDFLEASTEYACEDNSKCLTPVVLGCMDTTACNYNRSANINVTSLCCYVGYCNDRDIEVICPDLPIRNSENNQIAIFPNPAADHITVEMPYKDYEPFEYQVINVFGTALIKGVAENNSINISELPSGCYIVTIKHKNQNLKIKQALIKI